MINYDLFSVRQERKRRYSNVFETGDGPWVLQDIVKTCGVFQVESSVQGDGVAQALDTQYRAGQKAAALRILSVLKTTDAQLLDMLQDAEGEDYE